MRRRARGNVHALAWLHVQLAAAVRACKSVCRRPTAAVAAAAAQVTWYSAEGPDTLVEPTQVRAGSSKLHAPHEHNICLHASRQRAPAACRPCHPSHQVRLQSIHSKQPAVILFSNKSRFRVRALWLDFAGNEVRHMGCAGLAPTRAPAATRARLCAQAYYCCCCCCKST